MMKLSRASKRFPQIVITRPFDNLFANSPLDSGLELADGILTLENIINEFDLNQCRLVTLSACETSVSGKATSLLMTKFYQVLDELKQSGKSEEYKS